MIYKNSIILRFVRRKGMRSESSVASGRAGAICFHSGRGPQADFFAGPVRWTVTGVYWAARGDVWVAPSSVMTNGACSVWGAVCRVSCGLCSSDVECQGETDGPLHQGLGEHVGTLVHVPTFISCVVQPLQFKYISIPRIIYIFDCIQWYCNI